MMTCQTWSAWTTCLHPGTWALVVRDVGLRAAAALEWVQTNSCGGRNSSSHSRNRHSINDLRSRRGSKGLAATQYTPDHKDHSSTSSIPHHARTAPGICLEGLPVCLHSRQTVVDHSHAHRRISVCSNGPGKTLDHSCNLGKTSDHSCSRRPRTVGTTWTRWDTSLALGPPAPCVNCMRVATSLLDGLC